MNYYFQVVNVNPEEIVNAVPHAPAVAIRGFMTAKVKPSLSMAHRVLRRLRVLDGGLNLAIYM